MPDVSSVAELYAVAYQIEIDAQERYRLLAEQMEVHNHPELAAVFNELARVEGLHARHIADRARSATLAADGRRLGRWLEGESPESAEITGVHYRMSAREALELARAGEQRAADFFARVRDQSTDGALRALAGELHADELEHVALCERLLERHAVSGQEPGIEDPDPPNPQD